ncbi:MAG: hypothetical protein K2K53_08935 [Oscillospiraceae bacterium]|nr:hypothetical protein [Oscillospiraceae bacterium]
MTDQEKNQKAISQFESGDYRGAFLSFVEIFRKSSDEKERAMVLDILQEGYYQPNEDDIEKRYQKNCEELAHYPFQFGFEKHPLKELPVQIFPVTETEYCLYHKAEKSFSELREITSSERRDYLFKDLSQPLFRENDCNLYHLKYLWDNVRRSEDFGGDNHIYLYYESMTEFFPLLALGELKPLLEDRKFVFLVGTENRIQYPIDFKKRFQIDYAAMGPQPIRFEEMKRVCFWYKRGVHGGVLLALNAFGLADGIQSIYGNHFNERSTVNGQQLITTEEFKQAMSDVNHSYSVEEMEEMIATGTYELILDVFTGEQIADIAREKLKNLKLGGTEDFFSWLCRRNPPSHKYSIHDLFCGYFLWQYEKRNLNPRVPPIIMYEPHMWDPRSYSKLVLSFPYYTCLTSVREPIMMFARNYDKGWCGGSKFHTQFLLGADYVFAQFLSKELRHCYYGFRFEDLKMKPEAVCRAVCKHLDTPYDPKMLEADAPWPDMTAGGKVVRGFDPASLHRDISMYLSEFDQLRLKMFYAPILDHYGYPSFSFKEHPLPESLVRELLKYPFRFEYINHQRFVNPPSWDELHGWLQGVLQGALGKPFIVPKMIPLEETNE